jgi:hypothetical protein
MWGGRGIPCGIVWPAPLGAKKCAGGAKAEAEYKGAVAGLKVAGGGVGAAEYGEAEDGDGAPKPRAAAGGFGEGCLAGIQAGRGLPLLEAGLDIDAPVVPEGTAVEGANKEEEEGGLWMTASG